MLGCFRRRSTLMSASRPERCTATLPFTAAARGTRTCAELTASGVLLCQLVLCNTDTDFQAAGQCIWEPQGPAAACWGVLEATVASGLCATVTVT